MKDVPSTLIKEEYVLNTVHRSRNIHVVMKGVPTKSRKEEYVSGMVPRLRSSSAAMKGVPINLRKEEYVSGMVLSVHPLKLVVMKGVASMFREEEYVGATEIIRNAVTKDVQPKLFKEEYVESIVPRTRFKNERVCMSFKSQGLKGSESF